jgi:hypothetical protein
MSIPFNSDKLVLAVDSHNGIYSPKFFIEWYRGFIVNNDNGVMDSDIKDVLDGPDNEFYWEAWEDIMNNAVLEINGVRYTIMQNEDVWFIPENMEIPENLF